MAVTVTGGSQWGNEAEDRTVDCLARLGAPRSVCQPSAPIWFASASPERSRMVVV